MVSKQLRATTNLSNQLSRMRWGRLSITITVADPLGTGWLEGEVDNSIAAMLWLHPRISQWPRGASAGVPASRAIGNGTGDRAFARAGPGCWSGSPQP